MCVDFILFVSVLIRNRDDTTIVLTQALPEIVFHPMLRIEVLL